MIQKKGFLKAVVDSLPQQIAVLDGSGVIHFVNDSWIQFGIENGGGNFQDWEGVNYLDVCRSAIGLGDSDATAVLNGLQSVIAGGCESFSHEYACHSPDVRRWFLLSMVPLEWHQRGAWFVVTHQNITDRVLAEEGEKEARQRDPLTLLANRIRFDKFLYHEWQRCVGDESAITLMTIAIDDFNGINDTYGTQAGNQVLKDFASAMDSFGNRPRDLKARVNGNEFALVLGDTGKAYAETVANMILETVRQTEFISKTGKASVACTVSIGMATIKAGRDRSTDLLIAYSDAALHEARRNGGDQIVCRDVS